MSPLHSIGYVFVILIIILIIIGVNYVVNNDSVDRDSNADKKLIYILTGVFCFLILGGFLVLVSKTSK